MTRIPRSKNAAHLNHPRAWDLDGSLFVNLSNEFGTEAGRLTGTGDDARYDQLFLRTIVGDELPLTNMLILLPVVGNPDLIVEFASLLAFCMFVRTIWI